MLQLGWPEWFLLVWLAVFTTMTAVVPKWTPRPRNVAVFARTIGLPLDGDEEYLPALQARLRVRARWATIGTVGGATACVPIILTGVFSTEESYGTTLDTLAWVWLLAVLIVGRAIGLAVAAVTTRNLELDSTARRVVRLPRPTVREYVAPIERLGARGAVAAALLAIPATFATTSDPATRVLVVVVATASVVALVVAEWGCAALVAKPQPAVSEDLLRWDDALRAQTLRDIAAVPLAIGLLAFMLGWTTVLEWSFSVSADPWISAVLTVTLLAGLATFGAIALASRPERAYLRRLWPAEYRAAEPVPNGASRASRDA